MNGELVKQEQMNPGQLLTLAVDKDLDIEKLRQLMELQKAWEADQARKAFFSDALGVSASFRLGLIINFK